MSRFEFLLIFSLCFFRKKWPAFLVVCTCMHINIHTSNNPYPPLSHKSILLSYYPIPISRSPDLHLPTFVFFFLQNSPYVVLHNKQYHQLHHISHHIFSFILHCKGECTYMVWACDWLVVVFVCVDFLVSGLGEKSSREKNVSFEISSLLQCVS